MALLKKSDIDIKFILLFCVSVVIYRLLLDYTYAHVISPVYSYAGLINEFSSTTSLYSWVFVAITTIAVLPVLKKIDTFWGIVTIMLFLFKVVPQSSLIAFIDTGENFMLLELIYWFCVIVFMQIIPSPVNIAPSKSYPDIVNFFTFIMIVSVFLVSGIYAKFRIHFSLSDVYELRLEARSYNMPTILAYLWSATSNVLPILFVYYMSKKNKIILYIITFTVLLNFGINGSKSSLFKIILCLGLYLFYSDNLPKYISWIVCTLVFLGFCEFLIFKSAFIDIVVVRRAFFVPALLDYNYYDYVQKFGPTWYSIKDIAFVIGKLYYKSTFMRANNGCFSDAYVNMGTLGLIVYPLIYAIFVKTFSKAYNGLNRSLVFFCAFIFALALLSTTFTTALLTHGIFLACLLLNFMPRKKNIL